MFEHVLFAPNTIQHIQNPMRHNIVTMVLCIAASTTLLTPSFAAPEDFPDGIEFGDPNLYLKPDSSGNLSLTNDIDGLNIWSGVSESGRYHFDGGLHLLGDPVRIYLGSNSYDEGKFEVVSYHDALYAVTTDPLFAVESVTNTAKFRGVDVSINSGTLTVNGSAVLTQTSSTSYLTGQGFLTTAGLGSALSGITPPTSTTWTNVYVPRGTVSNSASAAFGTSIASASHAFANGPSNTTASGAYSSAMGYLATSSGAYSQAFGNSAVAEGLFSYAHGLQVTAKSASETVFGRFANMSSPSTIGSISGLDGLLRLGNGTSTSDRSEAMTVLKNGKTTLVNKTWSSGTPLADPSTGDTTDADGVALRVQGHTELQGKVTIEVPQGDIDMGIYD